MIASRFFEDYEAGYVRETLGRTITETDIVLHAGQTGDFYPHHMDEEWCRTQHFGRRIAHGTVLVANLIRRRTRLNAGARRGRTSSTADAEWWNFSAPWSAIHNCTCRLLVRATRNGHAAPRYSGRTERHPGLVTPRAARTGGEDRQLAV